MSPVIPYAAIARKSLQRATTISYCYFEYSTRCVQCAAATFLPQAASSRRSAARTFASSYPAGPLPRDVHRIDRILAKSVGELTEKDIEHIVDNIVRITQHGTNRIILLQRAERLLERLLAENMVQPNVAVPERAWNAVLRAYANKPDPETLGKPAHVAAHNILLRIQELHKQNPEIHRPASDYQISQVLRACANESTDEACELAEGLVRVLEEMNYPIKLEMYNNVLMLYSKQAPYKYDALGKAEDWLMHMAKRSAEVIGSPPPNTQTFNLVLIAWKDCPDELGATRALEVLQLMMKLGEGNVNVRPDPASFGIVIGAFGNRGQPRNSQVVLEKAFTYFTDHFDPTKALPDLSQCWTNTCFSWAKSGFANSPVRVEELLKLAQVIRNTQIAKKCTLAPNAGMHAAVLESYLTSQRLDKVDRATQHLWKMIENAAKEPQKYENEWPTTREFAAVFHAWYRRYDKVDPDEPEKHTRAAMRTETLLETMIELSERRPPFQCSPEANNFMHCIKLWCDASTAYSGDNSPQTKENKSSSEAMNAARKAVNLLNMAESRKVPMFESYAFVINALCRMGHESGAFEAAAVLKRLETQRDSNFVEWSKNAAGLYTAVITALGRVQSIEAAEAAHSILTGMPSTGNRAVFATSHTYTAVLSAYSKLGHSDKQSCTIVCDIFNKMKELDKDAKAKVRLDRVVFERVLRTLAKSNDPEMARNSVNILSYMFDLYQKFSRKEAEPTKICLEACFQVGLNVKEKVVFCETVDLLKRFVHMWKTQSIRYLPSERYFHGIIQRCKKSNMEADAAELEDFVYTSKGQPDYPAENKKLHTAA